MQDATPGEAVLITGVYGSGKSSVAMEIADIIEGPGLPYGLIDLDFLGWYGTPTSNSHVDWTVKLRNVRAVVTNFADVGVSYFILAGLVSSQSDLKATREILPVPMRVVRLTLSLEEITRRLSSDPTSGRRNDLAEAARQLARDEGAGLEDLAVASDRPLREVAAEIVDWLGWTQHLGIRQRQS
jgi:chloramphenicol 3-O-phosphotransferase